MTTIHKPSDPVASMSPRTIQRLMTATVLIMTAIVIAQPNGDSLGALILTSAAWFAHGWCLAHSTKGKQ